jgi:leucyl aminopeptidase
MGYGEWRDTAVEFSIKSATSDKHKTDCVVVGVFDNNRLTSAAASLDQASKKQLSSLGRHGDLPQKVGATLLLQAQGAVGAQRIMLVGLGAEQEFKEKQYREVVRAVVRALMQTGASDAVLHLPELDVNNRDLRWRLEQAVLGAAECEYRFDNFKSKRNNKASALKSIALNVAYKAEVGKAETAARNAAAIAAGVAFAKDLGNTPPNVCTPTYLAQQAKDLAKRHHLKVEVLEQRDMEKLGMGSLLSVTRGSAQPPKFIVLHHDGGKKKDRPCVLVGKGITFDTGGISLKPAPDMDEMKFDMSGAGSVLGTMRAVAQMKLPLNVIGLIPTCENMPSGTATRPGDIVTSMSGQTIEILNTDAEGRLILCDALTYAERFEPQAVIDIATLTGACVIALGHVVHGLYANNEDLLEEVREAGDAGYDRAWPMPLLDDYQEQLNSNFADMANIGGRPAGSVTAACYLARFAKKFAWAHLDIAGTAYRSGKEKGSTGRPVGLLTHFLMGRARP